VSWEKVAGYEAGTGPEFGTIQYTRDIWQPIAPANRCAGFFWVQGQLAMSPAQLVAATRSRRSPNPRVLKRAASPGDGQKMNIGIRKTPFGFRLGNR
jgi:hypothetical protein